MRGAERGADAGEGKQTPEDQTVTAAKFHSWRKSHTVSGDRGGR